VIHCPPLLICFDGVFWLPGADKLWIDQISYLVLQPTRYSPRAPLRRAVPWLFFQFATQTVFLMRDYFPKVFAIFPVMSLHFDFESTRKLRVARSDEYLARWSGRLDQFRTWIIMASGVLHLGLGTRLLTQGATTASSCGGRVGTVFPMLASPSKRCSSEGRRRGAAKVDSDR